MLCLLLASWLANPAFANRAPQAQRALFVEAEGALARGQRERFDELRARLADYPLHPYLQYRDALSSLRTADAARMRTALDALAGTPLASRLRNAWLAQLAREKKWSRYLSFYEATTDVALRCYHATALLRTSKREALRREGRKLWLSGRSRPPACDAPFAALLASGTIGPKEFWARFELALKRGDTALAGYLARQMAPARQRLARRWLELRRKPREIASLSPSGDLENQPLTRYAMRRLAYRDSAAALEIWQAMRTRHEYPAATRAFIDNAVGMGLALDHDPAATSWMLALDDARTDEETRHWRVRSALRNGDWEAVHQAIRRLTPGERRQSRWRYWSGRADIETGQRSRGQKKLAALAAGRGFYAFLAADRAGLSYRLNHTPVKSSKSLLQRVGNMAAMRRTHELVRLERFDDARREWSYWMRERAADEVAAAAALAGRWNWPAGPILALAKIRRFDDLTLRFPLAYRAQIERNARALNIPASWIFAIARRESAFVSAATSPAGARGLMQIMPATGRTLAKRLKVRYPGAKGLYEPARNLLFGASYLAQLRAQHDGQMALASAAYNAGPHRVRRWRPAAAMDAERWIETIPFRETRRYVQRVMEYDVVYRSRLGLPIGRLSDRLPSVTPLADAEG